jgi:hypothetical protein
LDFETVDHRGRHDRERTLRQRTDLIFDQIEAAATPQAELIEVRVPVRLNMTTVQRDAITYALYMNCRSFLGVRRNAVDKVERHISHCVSRLFVFHELAIFFVSASLRRGSPRDIFSARHAGRESDVFA